MNAIDFKDLIDGIEEDLPDTASVEFAVWAIGYDENDQITDHEIHLDSFELPEAAIKFAKELTLEDVFMDIGTNHDDIANEDLTNVAYFSIEVETVIEDPDEEGTMNAGTIWSKELRI